MNNHTWHKNNNKKGEYLKNTNVLVIHKNEILGYITQSTHPMIMQQLSKITESIQKTQLVQPVQSQVNAQAYPTLIPQVGAGAQYNQVSAVQAYPTLTPQGAPQPAINIQEILNTIQEIQDTPFKEQQIYLQCILKGEVISENIRISDIYMYNEIGDSAKYLYGEHKDVFFQKRGAEFFPTYIALKEVDING